MTRRGKVVREGRGPTEFRCERLGRTNRCEFHGCPYCFGDEEDLARREREGFCGFEPGVDPVNFGFPLSSARVQRG